MSMFKREEIHAFVFGFELSLKNMTAERKAGAYVYASQQFMNNYKDKIKNDGNCNDEKLKNIDIALRELECLAEELNNATSKLGK